MPFMSVLPNELWMSVFESLNNPSDLAKVLRTSKRFHDMAIRVLHRRLIWNDPRHFAESLNFWTNNAGTLNVPRILTVGISKMPPPQAHVERLDRVVAVVALNGALTHMPVTGGAPPALFVPLIPPPDTPNTTSKPCFVAAADLYTAMTNLMVTFNQLSNLHFRNAILPINIYGIIHGLHSLRCLRIEFCSFEAGTVDGPWDPATLPITELSLLGIESGNTNIRALSIAKARDLRILRFDASAFVAKLIVDAGGAFIVPQNLEYVDVRLPDKKLWPSSPHEAQALYITPLTGFLSMCPNVVRLSIGAFMPEFILRDNVLPNLRRYKGPISTVVTVAGRRPIYELNICDAGSKISDLTDALTLLGNSHSTLEELSVYVPYWDDEILYAVTQLFPNLRKLHIRYALGSPSEDLILSIGPHFVARTPQMHTIQIFSPRHHSAAELLAPKGFDSTAEPEDLDELDDRDPETELKCLVKCWDRYCPQLREVQLLQGFVWRKAEIRSGEMRPEWQKRKYIWVDGEREYGL